MSTISSLSPNLLRQLFPSAGSLTSTSGLASGSVAAPRAPNDQGQVSPFALVLAALQQLQQTDPAKYQQVTNAIATNLQKAATAAQKAGDSTSADALSKLAADFTAAAKTGELPNIQDLAKAIGGHHHRPHSGHPGGEAVTETAKDPATDPLLVILKTLADSLENSGLQASAASA